MSSVLIRRANMVSAGSNPGRLPAGYTELAYLESDGNQWIDTGMIPDNTTGFYVDIQKTVADGASDIVVGTRRTSGNTRCWIDITHVSSAPGNLQFGWNNVPASGDRVAVGLNRVTTKFNYKNDRKCYIDDVEYPAYSSLLNTALSSMSTYSLYLFSANRYGTVMYGFHGKVWSIQITSGSDVAHDYVPSMRDSDSVVGMYDLVGDTFLTNAGTGTFSYGEL